MPLAKDLLYSSPEEKRKHKKKCLVESPNSYFMGMKCPGCFKITTAFSHAQMVVLCICCSTVLCQPTGRKQGLQKNVPLEGSSIKSTLNQDRWETTPIKTFGHTVFVLFNCWEVPASSIQGEPEEWSTRVI
jgi:small subunit ribosomal protein S27e